MTSGRWTKWIAAAALASGLGATCTPSTVDVPASELEIRPLIMDFDPPEDGKVPVIVSTLRDGKSVQLASSNTVKCNGVALTWNGLGYAERVPIVAAGGHYTIVHARAGVTTQLVITVPPRPHVTSPTPGQSVARSASLVVGYVADGGTSVAASASDGSTGIAGNDAPDTGSASIDVSALHAGPGTVSVSRKFVTTPGGTGFAAVTSTFTIGSSSVHVTWQ